MPKQSKRSADSLGQYEGFNLDVALSGLDSREQQFLRNIIADKPPAIACTEAGYSRSDLQTLVRRSIVRRLKLETEQAISNS